MKEITIKEMKELYKKGVLNDNMIKAIYKGKAKRFLTELKGGLN